MCLDCDIKCDSCSLESVRNNLCISCNEGYYPIYNLLSEFKNCTRSPEGFYLDNDLFYKPCFNSCKKCNIGGNEKNHNCLECKDNYEHEIIFNEYKNCYINCSYYYFIDKNNKYCTINSTCPDTHDKLIKERKECIDDCIQQDFYKYEFRKQCYSDCPINSTRPEKNLTIGFINENFCKPICPEEIPFEIISAQQCVQNCGISELLKDLCILNFKEKKNENNGEIYKAKNIILENLEKGFTSEDYNASKLDNGQDEIIEYEEMKITLTTTENQKNNTDNDSTIVNLRECETTLRKVYNISSNELLYIKK